MLNFKYNFIGSYSGMNLPFFLFASLAETVLQFCYNWAKDTRYSLRCILSRDYKEKLETSWEWSVGAQVCPSG